MLIQPATVDRWQREAYVDAGAVARDTLCPNTIESRTMSPPWRR
jgi:hypothetical protein